MPYEEENFKINELHLLSEYVKAKKIYLNKIEFEFRKNSSVMLVRFIGFKGLKLSNRYIDKIKEQFNIIQEAFILPLIAINSTFVTEFSVDSRGCFSMSHTPVRFKIDCPKSNKIRGIKEKDDMFKKFHRAYQVLLPFVLYLSEIEFRGRSYEIVVIESTMMIGPQELKEIVENPIIAPRSREQWLNISSLIYAESQKEHSYHLRLPVYDGELNWENRIETVQVLLSNINKNEIAN